MRAVFGVDGICRYCGGKGGSCRGCGGTGYASTPPSMPDENSEAASDAIEPVAGTLRARVLAAVKEHGPVAEHELERILVTSGNTIRPRLWELERDGRIERHPEKGRTPSGRACWRYIAR